MSLTRHPAEIVEDSSSPLVAKHPDWPRVPLGSVATVLNGAAFKSKLFDPDDGVPLIRIRDIARSETSTRYSGEYDDRYLIQPGQLLVGMDGDFNIALWRGAAALLNQRVCRISPDTTTLDLDFLTHVLPGYLQAIHDVTSSTTVKHLSSRDIAEIPIPLPTISDQRRIAARLNEVEHCLGSVGAHLQTARTGLECLRSAVLAAACSGQITEGWREQREDSAVGLVAELRNAVGERKKPTAEPDGGLIHDIPATWHVVSLDLLIDRIEAGKSVRTTGRPAEPDEWGVIKVSAISWGEFREQENKAVTDRALINPRYEVRSGDLLLSRANTADLVGATVLVGKTRPQLLLSDKSLRLVPRKHVDKAWLNLALRSPLSRAQFSERATGTSESMRNLSQPKILSTTLALPPFDEQREIVRRATVALEAADRLATQIEQVEGTLDRISRASLGKAFRGELVPTEAALAAEEGRDFESAEELLARVMSNKSDHGENGRRR
jgi:type I restriction enzyme, S subunit